jgi:hypothetical protein
MGDIIFPASGILPRKTTYSVGLRKRLALSLFVELLIKDVISLHCPD